MDTKVEDTKTSEAPNGKRAEKRKAMMEERSKEPVEFAEEGEMEMNIEGTEEQKEQLLAAWNFLCEYNFDPPKYNYLFIMRVMNICQFNATVMENDDAQIALLEYLKFLYLKARRLCLGQDPDELLPSPRMDLVWREHILYTIKYRELCAGLFNAVGHKDREGRFNREYPKLIDPAEYLRRYNATLSEYQTVFGTPGTFWWQPAREEANIVEDFYSSVMWSVGTYYEKKEFAERVDLDQEFTLAPLELTETGKKAVSSLGCRKLTGEEVAKKIDAISFPKSLIQVYQRETRLPWDLTLRLFFEYKRFLWVSYIRPQFAVPSSPVDQIWHMHVSSTVNYDVETTKVFGHYLDHNPGGGTPEEKAEFKAATPKLQNTVEDFFTTPYDTEAWPDQKIRDDKAQSKFAWRPVV